MIVRWPIVVMSRLCLCRSSDERGSCRSLWPTHGRTHVSPKDYEDRLFLVDHGNRLLSVRSEVPKVPDARWSHSYATFGVACTHIFLAIFNVGYWYYWKDLAQVFQRAWLHLSSHWLLHQVGGSCFLRQIDSDQGGQIHQITHHLPIWSPSWADLRQRGAFQRRGGYIGLGVWRSSS